jgi:P27 family predicted phage terminase small subunit
MRSKSQFEKELHGTARADRKPRTAPNYVAASADSIPSHLDRAAKAEWKRTAPELEKLGLLKAVNVPLLAMYCQTVSLYLNALKSVQKDGAVILVSSQTRTGSTTVPRPNPALANMLKLQRAATQLGSVFGIDPMSSLKVETDVQEQEERGPSGYTVKQLEDAERQQRELLASFPHDDNAGYSDYGDDGDEDEEID